MENMNTIQMMDLKELKKFEDKVYEYLKQNQSNHVLYRVIPYFDDNNELANRCKYRGVLYWR